MPNITDALKNATQILERSGIAEPCREASSLLTTVLQKDKTFLIAHSEYWLSEKEEEKFSSFLNRRANREPFQYISGVQEFYGLDFIVTPDVLIPRPETELIVEDAIGILKDSEESRFCEIGIGSGCISISILHEVKNSSAIGLDISEKACEVARKNAEIHQVLNRFQLQLSDVFTNLAAEKFDLIVSNPPYISSEEMKTLQPEVRDFEPLTALTDGQNGLTILARIIAGAPVFLKPNGFLILEIGFAQAEEVTAMFDGKIWRKIDILKDLQSIPRTVRAQLGHFQG